jgi:hypothetical protein
VSALDLDGALDRLYGADLDAFVAERAGIVKTLKQEGRKAEAAQVQELRKPSLPVWVVNRLVREHRRDVDSLLQAGEGLEAAQTALLRGGDQAAFAKARDREQASARKLRGAAAKVLGARSSEATLERVVSTLRAAAGTAEGRAQLAGGRLAGEIEPHGFEAFAGVAPAPAPARPGGKDTVKRRQEAVAQAREKLKAARETEAARAKELRESGKTADAARRALDDAERTVDRARAARDAAAEAVELARDELEAAKASDAR